MFLISNGTGMSCPWCCVQLVNQARIGPCDYHFTWGQELDKKTSSATKHFSILVESKGNWNCKWKQNWVERKFNPTDPSSGHKKKIEVASHKPWFSFFHLQMSHRLTYSHHPSDSPLRSCAARPQLLLEGSSRSAVENEETIDLSCHWCGKSHWGMEKNTLHVCRGVDSEKKI